MIRQQNRDWGLLGLKKLVDEVRADNGNLHRLYEYTDAQVFTKMRMLHDKLDPQVKKWRLSRKRLKKEQEENIYINDCTKIIMDGQVSDSILSAQKLIDIKRSAKGDKKNQFVKRLTKEAEAIKKNIAVKLKISGRRIKPYICTRALMKYEEVRDTSGRPDEVRNKETVRLYDRYATGERNSVVFAAESAASILKHLIDKELVTFNVYFVEPTKCQDEHRRERIRVSFRGLVDKYFR